MHCYLFGENVRVFILLVTFSVDSVFSLYFYLPQNFWKIQFKVHALIIASGMVSTGFARLVKVCFFVSETLETVSVKCHYVLNS